MTRICITGKKPVFKSVSLTYLFKAGFCQDSNVFLVIHTHTYIYTFFKNVLRVTFFIIKFIPGYVDY